MPLPFPLPLRVLTSPLACVSFSLSLCVRARACTPLCACVALQHGFQHRGVVEGFTGIVKTDVVDHTMLGRTERLMQTPWTEHNHADGEHFLLFINLWIEQAKVASTNRFRLIHGRECRTTK